MKFKFMDLSVGWEVEVNLNDINQITKSENGTWFLMNTDGIIYEASDLWSEKLQIADISMESTFDVDVNDIEAITYNYDEEFWEIDLIDSFFFITKNIF